MDSEEFVDEVKMNVLRNHAVRLSDGDAWRAIESTFQTLAEQLGPEGTSFIAERLPAEIADVVEPAESRELFSLEEFFERVAELEAVDTTVASYYVRAVLETLSETLDSSELEELRRMLPTQFRPLFERGETDELETSL